MLEMMLGGAPAGAAPLKWYAFGACPAILTMKGNLYVTGNAGRLADENNTSAVLTKWKLIDTDVETVGFCSNGSLLWRKNNKQWWAIGYFGYMFGALNVAVKTNVSSYCTAIAGNLGIVSINGGAGVNTFIIGSNGTLYGAGRNAWQGLGSSAGSEVHSFILMANMGGAIPVASDSPQEHNLFLDTNRRLLITGNDTYGVSGSVGSGPTPVARAFATNVDKFTSSYYATHYLSGTTLFSAGAQAFGQLADGVMGGNGVANTRTSWYAHPETVLDVVGKTYGVYVKLADGWYFSGTYPRYDADTTASTATLIKLDTTGLQNPVFLRNQSAALQVCYDRGCFAFRGDTVTAKIPGYSTAWQRNWVSLPMTGVE